LLTGARILIAEDDPLIAMLLEDTLTEAGAQVLGPAATVPEGLALLTAQPHAALLDLNLSGETCAALADALAARGIPFIIASGDAVDAPLPAHHTAPTLHKPFAPDAAIALLARLIGRG